MDIPDRLEKQILLKAPLDRVWAALSDSRAFGTWFGMSCDRPFAPGAIIQCAITGTKMDPEIAAAQAAYEGAPFQITIERMEPGRLFSFRWHAYAVEPGMDGSGQPTTLIEFRLEPVEGGVHLTITESGFDRVPLDRRAKAFTDNEQGWSIQLKLIEKYVLQES